MAVRSGNGGGSVKLAIPTDSGGGIRKKERGSRLLEMYLKIRRVKHRSLPGGRSDKGSRKEKEQAILPPQEKKGREVIG